MKRNEVMALIATTILMFAVCLSASAKGEKDRTNQPCIEMNYGYCLDDASFNISLIPQHYNLTLFISS